MLYSIEIGSKDDLNKILRANKKIFRHIKKKSLIDKKEYEEILDKKKHLIVNVKAENMIVGDTIAINRGKNYHVWIIALTIDQIKQGIAKRLLNVHKQMAKDNKFEAISVTVHNEQQELTKVVLEEGFKVYRKSLKDSYQDYKIQF